MCFSFPNYKKSNKCNFIASLIKNLLIFAIILTLFAFFNKIVKYETCFADDGGDGGLQQKLEGSVGDVLEEIDFSELDDYVSLIDKDVGFFNGKGFKDLVLLIVKGEEVVSINQIFNALFNGVKVGCKALVSPLLMVLVVLLIINTFGYFKSDKISGVSQIVYFVCFSFAIIIISNLAKNVLDKSMFSIMNVKRQMDIIFPILLSMLASMGGVVSVASFSPLLVFLSNIISSVFVYILLPLFSLSLVLSIVGNLTEQTKLDKFNSFIKSVFKWVIGVVFAVFMGVLSVKSFSAGVTDGLSLKATKYAIKNYIPMLGGYISEGFEFVKAGCMLVKNATGIVGVLLLFFNILTPILLVAILELGLKLLAGVIEVVGDKKSSGLIYAIAGSLKLLIVVLVGVMLMYFLTVFVLMCSVTNFM